MIHRPKAPVSNTLDWTWRHLQCLGQKLSRRFQLTVGEYGAGPIRSTLPRESTNTSYDAAVSAQASAACGVRMATKPGASFRRNVDDFSALPPASISSA